MVDKRSRKTDPISWLVRTVQSYGLEWLFKRYWGIYRAIVVDVEDPDRRGRVRLMCPAIGQKIPGDVPSDVWALPCWPGVAVADGRVHGMFCPPEVGDHVWVFFELGKPEYPVYVGGFVIKVTGDEFQQGDPAKVRGFKTRAGHGIVFDDSVGNLKVRVFQGKGGQPTGSGLVIFDDESVEIGVSDGSGVMCSVPDQTVTVVAKDGCTVELGNDVVRMSNVSGSSVVLDGANVTIECVGTVKIQGGAKIDLDSVSVDVGSSASEPAVMGSRMATNWQTHVHAVTAIGSPTTPPATPPPVMFNELSAKVRVG